MRSHANSSLHPQLQRDGASFCSPSAKEVPVPLDINVDFLRRYFVRRSGAGASQDSSGNILAMGKKAPLFNREGALVLLLDVGYLTNGAPAVGIGPTLGGADVLSHALLDLSNSLGRSPGQFSIFQVDSAGDVDRLIPNWGRDGKLKELYWSPVKSLRGIHDQDRTISALKDEFRCAFDLIEHARSCVATACGD
jgi:hypothetical protein